MLPSCQNKQDYRVAKNRFNRKLWSGQERENEIYRDRERKKKGRDKQKKEWVSSARNLIARQKVE